MGHTREKIDCFLQAGEDQHNQQHNNQNGQQHNDPNGQQHNNQNGQQHNDPNGQQHNNQNGQQHNDPNGQQHNNQNGQQHHGTNNQGDQGESACAAIPHPDGSAHVDPPQEQIDAVEAEYAASCQAGACSLSEATYASLERLGHSRGEIDCFLAEGERQHNEEHGGTHPPAGNP
jgi:hypothetical protein